MIVHEKQDYKGILKTGCFQLQSVCMALSDGDCYFEVHLSCVRDSHCQTRLSVTVQLLVSDSEKSFHFCNTGHSLREADGQKSVPKMRKVICSACRNHKSLEEDLLTHN